MICEHGGELVRVSQKLIRGHFRHVVESSAAGCKHREMTIPTQCNLQAGSPRSRNHRLENLYYRSRLEDIGTGIRS
jgi:hypothetical protein